ncbi:protein-export chaperone SecB [Coxiella endosymbiont of Amblyomma sculptum]|uniref:protein-export chaperone SecB n=1 Tax=Coxiella endosymbiont of Amblyomma sculptum TaxID=2487929 RepID=UPI00132EE601|nr:protein-export chaperone SecB [Coxiella endosymbiont of Amblyomma sculptum]QHG92675.1 protein-export chaperone SecB [Coxiella endosymbiont of Amblyomma sculptum]
MAENKDASQLNRGPEFAIQRLYVKDLSFESPHSPQVFFEEWKPELDLDLTTKTHDLGSGNHEVVLTVKATVKIKEKTVFIAEIFQAGIFIVKNFPEDQMQPMLGSFCPNILYPYAREAITDMVVRGGFPHLYLAPVNFDLLLEQHNRSKERDRDRVH